MNWAWANSLDQIWRSPAFPMWLTLAAAGFFGIIVLITLLRAEKSVANGALMVIALLAGGIAVAAALQRQHDRGLLIAAIVIILAIIGAYAVFDFRADFGVRPMGRDIGIR